MFAGFQRFGRREKPKTILRPREWILIGEHRSCFHRLHRRGVLPPGFGLGLAVTKEMAEKLGGEISASGTPESGTVFQVAFCRG